MKTYTAIRGEHEVTLSVIEPEKPVRQIYPWESQSVYNHSPDGFEFGYGGSGPAQLALAILLDYFSGEPDKCQRIEKAAHHYHDFKFDFVARARGDLFSITSDDITDWIKRGQQ